jgi:hypothetical protein
MKILKITVFTYLLLFFLISILIPREEPPRHDYQFDIDARNDTTILNIYDGNRRVGTVPAASIEDLLINDNQ